MEISIPDTVVFYTQTQIGKEWEWKHYCFPHAVLRALEGEQIKTRLEDSPHIGCDDCLSFGAPRPHELGSLRRGS